MNRLGVVILALLTSFSLASDSAGEEGAPSLLSELTGAWTFDLDYIGEYLRKGAQMQEAWCGYSWPEAEIRRRERWMLDDAAKKGPPLVWEFRSVTDTVSELRISNNSGERKSKRISDCKIEEANIFACRQGSSSAEGPLYLRYDGQFLFVMVKMTPDMMSCAVKNRTPPAMWIAGVKFKRAVVQ